MAVELTLKQKLFSFDGRMRRHDYWMTTIGLNIVVSIVTELLALKIFGPEYSLFGIGFDGRENRLFHLPALTVQMIPDAATLWPALAMAAKRAHDRDRSARTVMALTCAVFVISYGQSILVAGGALDPNMALFASLPSLAISLYLFVVVGCLDGTPGFNRFGPSPKAPDSDPAEVFS